MIKLKTILLLTIINFLFINVSIAQTFGNNAAFSFLQFTPNSSIISQGGNSTGFLKSSPTLIFNNPSFITDTSMGKLDLQWANIYGAKHYGMAYSFEKKYKGFIVTTGLHIVDYGSIINTDAVGNILGNIKPSDIAFILNITKQYSQQINYGVNFKYANGRYSNTSLNGFFFDFAANYNSKNNSSIMGINFKNIGFILPNNYDIPFDLQISYGLKPDKLPFSFGIIAQQVQQKNILPTQQIADDGTIRNNKFLQNSLAKLNIYATSEFSKNIKFTLGLNIRNRMQLSQFRGVNGLLGFSAGFTLIRKNMQINYGTSFYTTQNPLQSFGICINTKQLMNNW